MMAKYCNAILFYHNKSGQSEIHQTIGKITPYFTQFTQTLTLHQTQAQGEIELYCAKIANDPDNTIDLLIVLGGDGTVNELVNGIVKNNIDIPMAIIPGGTFNDFTRTLQLSPNAETTAKQLVDTKEVAYDVLQVNDRFALNFVGLGLMVQNAENVDADAKSVLGRFSYIFSTLKTLASPESFSYELTIDNQRYTGDTYMLIIANGLYVGGNRLPISELNPSDGICNVFVLQNASFGALKEFIQEKSRIDWEAFNEHISHYEGSSLTLTTTPTKKIDIDGEIDFTTPIELSVKPKAVRILTVV